MAGRFADKVVLVTGASRGIGAATAVAFAAEGAKVAVNYRADRAGAESTTREIASAGGTGIVVQADVADGGEVSDLVATVTNELGPIDVLVNNAAAFDRNAFLDVEIADLDRVLATNVRALFILSQVVARSMKDHGGGAIVNVSSILARLTVRSRSAYSASKGAVESLTRAMALDVAEHGIRVNAVAPGLVSTEALLAGMRDPELQQTIQEYIPQGRFGDPAEVSAVILFLASDGARYVNGVVIGVDAGLGAREAGPP